HRSFRRGSSHATQPPDGSSRVVDGWSMSHPGGLRRIASASPEVPDTADGSRWSRSQSDRPRVTRLIIDSSYAVRGKTYRGRATYVRTASRIIRALASAQLTPVE